MHLSTAAVKVKSGKVVIGSSTVHRAGTGAPFNGCREGKVWQSRSLAVRHDCQVDKRVVNTHIGSVSACVLVLLKLVFPYSSCYSKADPRTWNCSKDLMSKKAVVRLSNVYMSAFVSLFTDAYTYRNLCLDLLVQVCLLMYLFSVTLIHYLLFSTTNNKRKNKVFYQRTVIGQ